MLLKRICAEDTVERLKAQIEQSSGVLRGVQQLFCGGVRALSDTQRLCDCSGGGHILRLSLLISKPHSMVICVKLPDRSVWPMQVSSLRHLHFSNV